MISSFFVQGGTTSEYSKQGTLFSVFPTAKDCCHDNNSNKEQPNNNNTKFEYERSQTC